MRRILSLLALLIVLGSTCTAAFQRVHAADSLYFSWQAPPFRLKAVMGADGQTYTRVEMAVPEDTERYSYGGPPGSASLPRRAGLVALPPEGAFGLELIEVVYEETPLRLEYPVERIPFSQPEADGPGPGFYAPGQPLAGIAGDGNPDPVSMEDAVWMRDHRLARVLFAPFRYDAARGTLEAVRRVRFRVWWERPAAAATPVAEEDPARDVLASLVLNPANLDAFRAFDRRIALDATLLEDRAGLPPATQAPTLLKANANQAYKLRVEEEGIYALDNATLVAAGVPVADPDPAAWRLFHGGVEVPLQWEGDGDSVFEANERLLFYAQPRPTRFAGYDVYWLAWDGTPGQRMTLRAGDPTGLPPGIPLAVAHVEQNVEYDSLCTGHDGDRWFWARLKQPDVLSADFGISLSAPLPATAGELTVWLHSYTEAAPDPDHHVHLSLNGTSIGDARWEGAAPYTATLDLPAGLLKSGLNTLHLSLPGDIGSEIEGTWVDAIAVRYGLEAASDDMARFQGETGRRTFTVQGFSSDAVRVYDVSEPDAPRIVTGFVASEGRVQVGDDGVIPAEYLVLTEGRIRPPQAISAAKSVAEPTDGADYLIVTHPEFEAALAPLVAHRRAQGLKVAVVDVEAVYDQFGDGRMDPAAIRSFLAHAYATWPGPALQFVLLVGDGTYDPRHYRPDTIPTYLPPYLADVDPDVSETGSDNRYADLTGDPLPEVRLGRFPVNSEGETQAIVDKIIRYETDPLPGDWNHRLVFGADNPSDAGDHHEHADGEFNTYATDTSGYRGARVYLSEVPGAAHLYTDAETAQDALIAELNRGALFYTYFGHASWHQEAVLETDNYAPLFHRDHIARLSNQRRWPVVLHMTCLTGRYIHLTSNTLDESLLRARDVGAIAVWGASGNGVATGHRLLHRSFYRAVLDEGEDEVSGAVQAALITLYATGAYDDLIETYHLFGDPALKLHLSSVDLPFSIFLPIMTQNR